MYMWESECTALVVTKEGTGEVTLPHCGGTNQDALTPPELAHHLAGAGFALRCWPCNAIAYSASADAMIRSVYGVLSVAVLVVH